MNHITILITVTSDCTQFL